MSAEPGGQTPNKRKILPCRYGTQAECPFGHKCKFGHRPREVSTDNATIRDPVASGSGQRNRTTNNNQRGNRRQGLRNARGRGGKVTQTERNKGGNDEPVIAHALGTRSAVVNRSGNKETPNEMAQQTDTGTLPDEQETIESITRKIEEERLEKERWAKKIADDEAEHKRMEERLREEREREAVVVEQYFVSESSLVTCGAGLAIQNVIPGFELCQITIKNLPADAKINEVEDILVQQGIERTEFNLTSLKREQAKATQQATILAKAEHGEAISAGLDGMDFRDSTLSFEVTQNTNVHNNSMGSRSNNNNPILTISWFLPSTTLRATYASPRSAAAHQSEMNQKIFRGRRIRAVLDNRPARRDIFAAAQTSVRLYNLPANTNIDDDLFDFTGTHALNVLFAGGPANPRDTLLPIISVRSGVRMDTLRDIPQDALKGECKVEVQFDSYEEAKSVYDFLHRRKVGYPPTMFRPWLARPHQYEISVLKEQYQAQKNSWDELSEKKEDSDAFVTIRIPADPRQPYVFVRAVGDNKKTVGALKVRVESLASGRKLDSQTHWHSSFTTKKARPLFDRVKRETGVFVRSDFKVRGLKVYGDATKLDDACRIIKEEADRLRGAEVMIHIEPWMVRFFVSKGLEELQELLGEEQVRLDITSHNLVVKGGDEATQQAYRLIQEARTKGRVSGTSTGGGDGEAACAVCTDTASHPELLVCGHTYCKACLKHFIVSAVDGSSFPITCVGDGNVCKHPISIPVICRFLTPHAFDALVETVFRVYMEEHHEEFKYCTTADCKQIYRHGGDDDVQCPSCFATFCPKCDEPHEGMSCAEWKAHKDPDGEHEGLGSLGYKRCPNCNIWVDRTEGCNHITCVKCKTHFCWLCLASYENGGEVYGHMTAAHGGWYEDGRQEPGPANAQGGNVNPFGNVDYAQQQQELERIQQQRAAQENARRLAEVMRQQRERRRQEEERQAQEHRQQEADQRWQARLRQVAAERDQELRRQAAERQAQERRRQELVEEERRRHTVYNMAQNGVVIRREREERDRLAALQVEEQKRKEEGWGCIVM